MRGGRFLGLWWRIVIAQRKQHIDNGLQVGKALAAFGQYTRAAPSRLHKHQMRTQCLTGLQMLRTTANGPDFRALSSIAFSDLLEQRRAGLAASAVFIGRMGAEKHGFHPSAC